MPALTTAETNLELGETQRVLGMMNVGLDITAGEYHTAQVIVHIGTALCIELAALRAAIEQGAKGGPADGYTLRSVMPDAE